MSFSDDFMNFHSNGSPGFEAYGFERYFTSYNPGTEKIPRAHNFNRTQM